jgi:hypothetical protein
MVMEIQKVLENIQKSAELVLEHYNAKGFRNTLIEVGLRNIMGLAQAGIEMIEKNQVKETL